MEEDECFRTEKEEFFWAAAGSTAGVSRARPSCGQPRCSNAVRVKASTSPEQHEMPQTTTERGKQQRTDSETKRKQFIAPTQNKILNLERPSGSIIHNFLPPQHQSTRVIVAFIDASGHIQLQAAVAQIPSQM